MSELLPPVIEQSHVGMMDRMRSKWATIVAVGAASAAVLASPTIEEQPAYADTTAQVIVGMPFTGKWGFNAIANPPYTDFNSSHPSAHDAHGFDWATDVYAAVDAEVKVYGSSPQGTVTFKRNGTSDTCSSKGPNIAGKGVTFDVLVNGTEVGEVKYDHLDLTDVGDNAIASGTKIGEVTSEPLHSTCYQTSHTHVQLKNTVANNSCYVDHGRPGESDIAAGTNLGVLGSTNTGAKEVCASIPSGETPPPPPDTDHDGINDPQDQCPTVPGIPGLQGCPPRDIDRDGIADFVILNTANTGSGVTEAHELAGSGGYTNWLGHQATAVGYVNATQQTLMGDTNADYRPDLVVVNTANTGSGKVEVHAMDGTTGFSTWLSHDTTILDYTNSTQKYALADLNEDNRADLLVINTTNTGSGKVEAHALDAATHYSTWIGHWVTPADYLNLATQQVLVGDANGDKRPDILIVNTAGTGSGKVEVHEINGANGFSTWQGHQETPLSTPLGAAQRLAIGDANADKVADLVVVNTDGTQNGSGKVEVHPLSGATHYSAWLGHYTVNPLALLNSTQRVMMGG